MASGSMEETKDNPALKTITRKGIGELLDEYIPKYIIEPIDCFFFQFWYPIDENWMTSDAKQEFERGIAQIVEAFFQEKAQDYRTWYKVTDGWPSTYFLNAEERQSKILAKAEKSYVWYDFEEQLNKMYVLNFGMY